MMERVEGNTKGGAIQIEVLLKNILNVLSKVILAEWKNVSVQIIYVVQPANEQSMCPFYPSHGPFIISSFRFWGK